MSANYSGLKDIDMMPYRMIEKLIEEADEIFGSFLSMMTIRRYFIRN